MGRRRLPDRHHEARQRRVLAGVRARGPRVRAPPGQARVLHVRRGVRHHEVVHVALHDARRRAGGDRLPVPGRGRELRRRSTAADDLRDFFAGDDWYTDADSNVYQLPTFLGNHDMGRIGFFVRRRTRARPTPSWWRATAWPTSSCTSPAATRSSTTATSRASRAPAATRSPARTCSRAVTPRTTTSTTTWYGADRPHARRWSTTSTPRIRCTGRSATSRGSRSAITRCATARRSTASASSWRLRLLAARPRAPARVRGRAQQLRELADRRRADLHVARLVRPGLRRQWLAAVGLGRPARA